MDNMQKLVKAVEINIKFNDKYKLMYYEPEAYNRITDIISDMRKNKEIEQEERHTLYSIFKHYYRNFYKIKQLIDSEPRVHAQKFIGKRKIREFIFKRDGYKCLKCGNINKLQIDHINPISRGGENKLSNLQTLCNSCNSKKRDNFKDYRNG